jgi:hypothetical protein
MGKPGRGHARSSRAEFIGTRKRTQGTETSKYLVERTSTETPLVVASERGSAQTGRKQFQPGLWDLNVGSNVLVERTGKSGHRG